MTSLAALAGLVVGARPGDAPQQARRLAVMALVDLVGCTIAGVAEPVADCVLDLVGEPHRPGHATIIGTPAAARPLDAAFANGTIGHALDLDDSNMAMGGHPSVVLYPALLALAETGHCSGAQLIDAYIAGFEAMMALARAVNFEHYEKGWHPTATLGVFGAAAASARMLGLDESRTTAALGLAASSASGLKANFGTMAKPIQVGEASRRGLLCAMLARRGAKASADALDAQQGFFRVYNGDGQFRAEAIGPRDDGVLELLSSGIKFKRYACCGSTHAPIDAALALRARHALAPETIATVEVALNPRRRPHVDRPVLADVLAAKFSVQYAVAAALVDGAVGLQHFTPAALARPDLAGMMTRVRLADLVGNNAALAQACRVDVTTAGGDRLTQEQGDAEGRGAEAYAGIMRQKFLDCASAHLSRAAAEAVLERLLSIETAGDVAPLMRQLATAAGGQRAKVTA